jgi:heme-degrading monooxygenase HmoA
MTFREEKIPEFLELFEEVKGIIKNFDGCRELLLFQDINNPSTIFTYSIWVDELSLNNYRSSAVFQSIWVKTKSFFSIPAEAWSLTNLVGNYKNNLDPDY